MTEKEAINALMEAFEIDYQPPEDKKLKYFRFLYVVSLVLTPTVIGALVGVPVFLFLLIFQYIIFGEINPHFTFRNTDKAYAERFVIVCCFLWTIALVIGIGVLIFDWRHIRVSEVGVNILIYIAYAVYINFISYVLRGKLLGS